MSPGELSPSVSCARCSRATAAARLKPSPLPLARCAASPTRTNGRSAAARSAGAMPGPLSATLQRDAVRRVAHAHLARWPPDGTYLSAFSSRLVMSCASSWRLPRELRRLPARRASPRGPRRACPAHTAPPCSPPAPRDRPSSPCVVTPAASARAICQQRRERALHAIELLERRRRPARASPARRHRVAARSCASSSRTRSRYSGVRRSCAMLSNAVRSVVGLLLDAVEHGVDRAGQRVELVARAVGAQPLREVAVHDGLAGDGVVAHAPRGAARVGRAQQPHRRARSARCPTSSRARSGAARAGARWCPRPPAASSRCRRSLDARLDRMQHRLAAFVRARCRTRRARPASRDVARPCGADCPRRAAGARRPAGTPRRCVPSCRCAGAAWRPRCATPPRRRSSDRSSTSARTTAAISRSSALRVSR